jgi:hypothetical protein
MVFSLPFASDAERFNYFHAKSAKRQMRWIKNGAEALAAKPRTGTHLTPLLALTFLARWLPLKGNRIGSGRVCVEARLFQPGGAKACVGSA